jgi:hypothetical protein
MRTATARRRLATGALLLLAVVATVAFGERAAPSVPTGARSAAALTSRLRDDARVVAAVPTRAIEWATGHRGSQGDDHLVAVLFAATALMVAAARRRSAARVRRARGALGARHSAIRGPPAFAFA